MTTNWPYIPPQNCCCYCSSAYCPWGCASLQPTEPASSATTRHSRLDDFRGQPHHMTLFRAQSCRRLEDNCGGCGGQWYPEVLCYQPPPPPQQPPLFRRASGTCGAFDNPEMFLTPPIVFKDRSGQQSQQRSCSSRTPSRVRFCQTTSPCRPGCCGCSGSNVACCPDRVIYPSSGCGQAPRESSIVRVISRANSPLCETFLAASLPSKAACCSVACSCDLKPACQPKPRGNLKYSHLLQCRKEAPVCYGCDCIPQPRKQATVDCCTETVHEQPIPRCYSITRMERFPIVECEAPKCTRKEERSNQTCCDPPICCVPPKCCDPPKPPCRAPTPAPYERVETTSTRMERVTTRRRATSCAPQRTQAWKKCVCERDARYYLQLVGRKENELWDRISECDLDLVTFEYMMCTDVSDYVKESIEKSRDLIHCEFANIRRICEPDATSCCPDTDIEKLWREAQCKLSEVMCMMDRVDSLRHNRWKW